MCGGGLAADRVFGGETVLSLWFHVSFGRMGVGSRAWDDSVGTMAKGKRDG